MSEEVESTQPANDAREEASTSPPRQGESPPTKPQNDSRLRRISRYVWWRSHWLAPNLIPPPYVDRAYQQARDKESNDASRVSADEELCLPAVWGVELFGPNESERLYKALGALCWTAGFRSSDDGALTWVQQQRAYGRGGTYNVGPVTSSTGRLQFVGSRNHASLPKQVEYLLVHMHQIVPAVTCMVVCFVLKDEPAAWYRRELNLDRRSRSERGPRWSLTRWDPSHIKQRAVEGVRERINAIVDDWFKENLPGYFAGSHQSRRRPIVELLSTESKDLFSLSQPGLDFDWRRIIVNAVPHEVWTSKDLQGLRFVVQRPRWPREQEHRLIACVVPRSLPSKHIEMYGGGASATVAICHEALEGTLAYFGTLAFLTEVSRDLKGTREELNLARSSRATLRTIDRIRQYFDRNAGVPAVARELRDATSKRGLVEHYCEVFTAQPWKDDGTSRVFAKELRERLHASATALIEDEAATREHFQQLSTILSIRESVRAQRRMEFVAIAALLVAAVTLVVEMPDNWMAKLWRLLAAIQP